VRSHLEPDPDRQRLSQHRIYPKVGWMGWDVRRWLSGYVATSSWMVFLCRHLKTIAKISP